LHLAIRAGRGGDRSDAQALDHVRDDALTCLGIFESGLGIHPPFGDPLIEGRNVGGAVLLPRSRIHNEVLLHMGYDGLGRVMDFFDD